MNWASKMWRPFCQPKSRNVADLLSKEPAWYGTYWKSGSSHQESPVKKIGPLMVAATLFYGPRQWLVRQWLVSPEKKRSYPFPTASQGRSEDLIPKKKAKIETQENATKDEVTKPQRRKLVRRPPVKPDQPLERKRRFTRTLAPQVIVTEDLSTLVSLLG